MSLKITEAKRNVTRREFYEHSIRFQDSEGHRYAPTDEFIYTTTECVTQESFIITLLSLYL